MGGCYPPITTVSVITGGRALLHCTVLGATRRTVRKTIFEKNINVFADITQCMIGKNKKYFFKGIFNDIPVIHSN